MLAEDFNLPKQTHEIFAVMSRGNFISSNGNKITHVIVAHTHFRPCNKSKKQIELMTLQAKKNLRHALNCFSKLLYSKPNRPTQNPQIPIKIQPPRMSLRKAIPAHSPF